MDRPEIGTAASFISSSGKPKTGKIWFVEYRNNEWYATIEVKKPLTYHYLKWEDCNV